MIHFPQFSNKKVIGGCASSPILSGEESLRISMILEFELPLHARLSAASILRAKASSGRRLKVTSTNRTWRNPTMSFTCRQCGRLLVSALERARKICATCFLFGPRVDQAVDRAVSGEPPPSGNPSRRSSETGPESGRRTQALLLESNKATDRLRRTLRDRHICTRNPNAAVARSGTGAQSPSRKPAATVINAWCE